MTPQQSPKPLTPGRIVFRPAEKHHEPVRRQDQSAVRTQMMMGATRDYFSPFANRR